MKKDTTPDMAQKYQELIMALSPGLRVSMGCAMFDSARKLMEAGLAIEPNPQNIPLRTRILHRLYKRDYSPQELEKITNIIESSLA